MAGAVIAATYRVAEKDLQAMVLQKHQLPEEFQDFQLLRERVLDNETLAEHGFPGNTAEDFERMGRITGYVREFVSSQAGSQPLPEGTDLVVATVAHLFRDHAAVSQWMAEVFIKQFEENVGRPTGNGQELVAAERLEVKGFHDEAVGILAVQQSPNGLLSSTVVDFRMGRILGVAYVVTSGRAERLDLVTQVGIELERQIVRVILA